MHYLTYLAQFLFLFSDLSRLELQLELVVSFRLVVHGLELFKLSLDCVKLFFVDVIYFLWVSFGHLELLRLLQFLFKQSNFFLKFSEVGIVRLLLIIDKFFVLTCQSLDLHRETYYFISLDMSIIFYFLPFLHK